MIRQKLPQTRQFNQRVCNKDSTDCSITKFSILFKVQMQQDINYHFRQMQKRIKKKQSLESSQIDEISDDTSSHQLNHFEKEDVNRAKENLKLFIKELGEDSNISIKQNVLQYYSQVNSKYLTPESIVKLVDKRVQKMIKNKKIKKNWSKQDVHILVWVLFKYLQHAARKNIENISKEDWKEIAKLIPGTTGSKCMFKWLSLKKINLAQHKWQEQEASLLASLVEQFGCEGHWRHISERLYEQNQDLNKIYRNAKMCKQHWSCHLNPNLKKGYWTPQQDRKLLQIIIQNQGMKKWCEMVKDFQGRTQNAIKNRYQLIINKQKKKFQTSDQLYLIKQQLKILPQKEFNSLTDLAAEFDLTINPQKNNNQIFNQDNTQEQNTGIQTLSEQLSIPKISQMKIIRSNFHFLVQYIKNNVSQKKQLFPAVLTDTNSFLLNKTYS